MIIIDKAGDCALAFLLEWIGDNLSKVALQDYGDALVHARLLSARCRGAATATGYSPRAFFEAVEGLTGSSDGLQAFLTHALLQEDPARTIH